MATRMQQRRGTAQQWTDADPILAAGEIGFETDTNQFKIGDGVNNWSNLSYFKNLEDLGGSLDDYVPVTTKGQPNGVAELDSTGNIPVSQLGNLIDGAPAALNTLNELADALNNDNNFAAYVANNLILKAPIDAPTFTGEPHAPNPQASDNSTRLATTAFVKDQGYGLDSDIDALGVRVTTAEGAISTLETTSSGLVSNMTQAQNDIDSLETTVSSHTSSLSTAAGQISTLQTGLSGAETDIDNLQTDLNTANTSISSLDTLTSGHTTNITTLQSDVSNANTSISSLDTLTSGHTASIATLQSDVSTAESNILSLQSDVSTAESNITTIQGDLDTAEATLATVVSDLDTHEAATTSVHGIADTTALATKTYADSSSSNAAGTVATNLTNHENDTTSVHGIADTSKLVTTDATSQTLSGNLTIAGNLTVSGTTQTVSSTTVTIADPMIYLGGDNSGNSVDLGFVSSFNDGTYQHSGLVRDASDSKWKLFKGVTDEPTTTVNFTQGSLDALAIGALEATSATIGGTAFTDKADKTAAITSQTGAYTIASADVNSIIEFNSQSGASFTIPADNSFWPVGQRLEVLQVASGQVTIAGGSGVTVTGTPTTKTRTQWSGATIIKRAANTFVVVGDLASS